MTTSGSFKLRQIETRFAPDPRTIKRIVHCKRQPFDVYIGRPSKWGNPFEIGVHGSRKEVIAMYEQWIRRQPQLMAALPELEGKILGCWCDPKPCHGDVLLKLLAERHVPTHSLGTP